jgi:DNA (cytosine-5)-methyltransferase 1
MAGAYYNEIDPYAAQWLRNLIKAGHIAAGDVDERSIEDVRPDDLRGFTQCHFFAGIGVWSYALRLAGWPDDRPVWTGSCPCQPFSAAGKGAGFADERHLWPAWAWLIGECRPAVILGEQVASKDIDPWIDLVQADVEAMGYALGCVPFPSAGVGAPHIRDRAYFMAHADHARSQGRKRVQQRAAERAARSSGVVGIVADAESDRHKRAGKLSEPSGRHGVAHGSGMADAECERIRTRGCGGAGSAPNSLQGIDRERQRVRPDAGADDDALSAAAGPTNGFWRAADWLLCRDEKWRPVEPGTFPLVTSPSPRVVRVCAACLQKGSIDESVRKLLETTPRHEGRLTAQVLLQGLHGQRNGFNADHSRAGAVSSAAHVSGDAVQSVSVNDPSGAPPSRRESDEQLAGEHRNPLRQVPSSTPCATPPDIGMRDLQEGVHGEITPEQSQSVLCDLCGGMGANLRQATLVGNRVGRLRAYGNAINAQAAAEFIRSAREAIDLTA